MRLKRLYAGLRAALMRSQVTRKYLPSFFSPLGREVLILGLITLTGDIARTALRPSMSNSSIRIKRSISKSCERPIGLSFPLAVSKREKIPDISFEQIRILVMLAFSVLLRPKIDLSWTALLSKYRRSGLPFVFQLSSAWTDLRRDKIRGSSSVTICRNRSCWISILGFSGGPGSA